MLRAQATRAERVQAPNRREFTATANAQGASAFFSLLPAEVRQLIYVECWRSSGNGSLRQHVTIRSDTIDDVHPHTRAIYKLPWTHVPCVTDPDAEDVRYQSFQNAGPGTLERAAWMQRLKTEWCLHWACEEADIAMLRASGANGLPVPQTSSFLPVLMTCKRMYLEALPSIYANVTFVFTGLTEAADFLGRYTPDLSSPGQVPSGGDAVDDTSIGFRSIEICIRATNLLTELYFPYAEMAAPGVDGSGSEGPLPVRSGGMRLSMENNPWARVCSLLARQPNLHALRVWFDTRDLRPWHKRVSEARLFAKLFDVRVRNRDRFVLALPELPERSPDQERDWVPFGLAAHHFLDGELVENAPFVVVRGPRPNNWRLHMGDRFGDRFLTDLRAV